VPQRGDKDPNILIAVDTPPNSVCAN